MKKLLLAALALLGLAAPQRAGAVKPTMLASPVTELTDGNYYYIYDAHADNGSVVEQDVSNTCRYAFRYASGDTGGSAVNGTHIKPVNAAVGNQLNNHHVWKAIATESGAWKFQNAANDLYLTAQAKVNVEANAASVVLETTSTAGTFKVKQEGTTNTRWDGNPGDDCQMVYWNGDGHPIQFFQAVANDEGGYSFAETPIANFPEYTTDSSNTHYYLISNLRVRGGRGPTYATAPGASGQISLRSMSELTQYTGRYEIGALWYFEECDVPEGVHCPFGYIPVKIYNALTGQAIANVLSGDWRTEGNDIVWYITPNSNGGYNGFNILSTPNVATDGSAWNNAAGNGLLVEYYKGNDVGSIFGFELADNELTKKTLDAIIMTRLPLAIAKGNVLKKLGVSSDEALEAWNAAVAATEVEDTEATIEEYQAVVSAYINLQKSVKESNIRIRHKSHEYEYIAVADNHDVGSEIRCIGVADNESVGHGTRVFTLVPTDDGSGFYLHNIFKDCYVVHPNNNTNNVTVTTDKSQASVYNFDVWVENSAADGSIGLCEINLKPDVAYLKSTDDDTKLIRGAFDGPNASWFIEIPSDEIVDENLLTRAQAIFGTNKPKADGLVALGAISDDAKTAWTTACAAVEALESYDEATFTAAETAFDNLTKQIKENISINVKHRQCDRDYISVNSQGNIVCGQNHDLPGTRALTLTMAENGKGFNIFSEYAGKYITHPTADNGSVGLTSDKAQASVYKFDVWAQDGVADSYLFCEVNTAANRAYFHTNTQLSVVTRWEYCLGSAWYVELVGEDEAANEYLTGAKAYFNGLSGITIGTGLGEYSLSDSSPVNVGTDASIEEKRAAGNKLRSGNPVTIGLTINQPVVGHIYEFAKADESKYMSCENGNTNSATMVTQTAENLFSTLFYLDEDHHLVALEDGKVLGKFGSTDKNTAGGTWSTVLLEETNKVGTFTFGTAATAGKYTITTQEGRHLYNGHADVDAGGGPGEVEYHWTIKDKGAWTPIPGTDRNQTTVLLPFAMHRKANMTFYTAKEQNGKLILTEFTDDVIPGNVPFILDMNDNVDRDATDRHVYLQKASSEGRTPEHNDLCGSIYAKTNTDYAIRSGNKFLHTTDAIVEGFHAHVHHPITHTLSPQSIEDAIDALEGKVFGIKNIDATYRGYLIYDPARKDAIWTTYANANNGGSPSLHYSSNAAADEAFNDNETNLNFRWTLVKHNGKRYLYNLAAQKFAAAYVEKGDGVLSADYSWQFSDYPTAIDFHFYDNDHVASLEDALFNILGGENTATAARPAGMAIINNNYNPVPCVSGNAANDGCIFQIKVIDGLTAGEVASADAALAAMEAEHSEVADYIGNHSEDHYLLPGHFNAAGYEALTTALDLNNEALPTDTQSKYYRLVRARKAAMTNITRFEDNHEGIYKFADKHAVVFMNPVTKEYYYDLVDEFDPEATNGLFKVAAHSDVWQCQVTDEGVNFIHTFTVDEPGYTKVDKPAAPAAVRPRFAAESGGAYGSNDFAMFNEPVSPTYKDGMGTVETPSGASLKVASTATEDDLVTTGIAEITVADTNAANTVYDLQGRRVNKAGRGLYIVNGKKTLLR